MSCNGAGQSRAVIGNQSATVDKRQAIAEELPRLRRYARALQGDPGAADDLVQDCVERALSRLHLFRDGTNMRAWLFTILHNIHVNTMRRQKRAVDNHSLALGIDVTGATGPSQGDGLALRDLSHALRALSEEQRQAVLLIGLEDMSYREAAEVLSVPIGTVMSRLARGRERLRELTGRDDAPVLRSVR